MLNLIFIVTFCSMTLVANIPKVDAASSKKKKVKHIIKNPKNPGIKAVISMLNGFDRMGDNKQGYVNRKYDYKKYKEKETLIARDISAIIDFWDVCEKSLRYNYDPEKKRFRGDHWKGKSLRKKEFFVGIFKNLIENIVYPIANDFFGELKIVHEVIKSKGNTIHVKSTIYYKKKDVITEWYLHKRSDGKWIIHDIGVEGERWVISFRSQFNDIVSKKSYKELLSLMKKKLKEVVEDSKIKDKKDRDKAIKKVAKKAA